MIGSSGSHCFQIIVHSTQGTWAEGRDFDLSPCSLRSCYWKSSNFCMIVIAGLNQESSSAETAVKYMLNLKQMLLTLILNQGLTVLLLNYRKD